MVRTILFVFLFCYAPVIFLSCCLEKETMKSNGSLILTYFTKDSITNELTPAPHIFPAHKIWYKDSLVIEEVVGLNMGNDTSGKDTTWLTQEPYIFIDLRKDYYYKYKSFSDTTAMIDAVYKYDSIKWGIPWDFYTAKGSYYGFSSTSQPDTSIKGVSYKRLLVYKPNYLEGKNNMSSYILYMRCDKKNTLFQFDKKLGDKLGCPIIRIDDKNSVSELQFITDNLSKEELRIFDAWEKNAKNYQVKHPRK